MKRKVILSVVLVMVTLIATCFPASAEVHFAAGDGIIDDQGIRVDVGRDNNIYWPNWTWNPQNNRWEMKWVPPAHTPANIPIEPRYVLANNLPPDADDVNFILDFTVEVWRIDVNPNVHMGTDSCQEVNTAWAGWPEDWSEAIGPINCVGNVGQQNMPTYRMMVAMTLTHTDPNPDDVYSDTWTGYIYVS